MLDYKKTEDMERMKAEAVKRLKWPKIPGLNEAFAKGIVMVSDGTNGDVKLRNLTIYEKYMVTNFEKIQHAIVYHTILTETKFGKMLSMLFVGKYEDEWFMDEENFKKSYTQVYVENLDYPDCSEIGTIIANRTVQCMRLFEENVPLEEITRFSEPQAAHMD